MDKKFWKPSLTTQYVVCPVPYHMDTYRGCAYGCIYCSARDSIVFTRRNSGKNWDYLEGQRADLLDSWIQRTLDKDYDYRKSEEVAFKERIPIKMGTTTDPFPYVEAQERVTYDVLKVLEKYDYPLEIQTKNPEILAEYAHEFENPNWTIAVTIISADEEWLKLLEPRCISAERRFKAIKKLTDMGIKVMFKVQPAIYPKVLADLPLLFVKAKEHGCWAMVISSLGIRVSMPKHEQANIQKIGDYLGFNYREFYKQEGCRERGSYRLSFPKREECVQLSMELAKGYGIKYLHCDNYSYGIGHGPECCGTEFLRNHKIWGKCERIKGVWQIDNGSEELGKCYVNFTRSTKYKDITLEEATNEKIKENEKLRGDESWMDRWREKQPITERTVSE